MNIFFKSLMQTLFQVLIAICLVFIVLTPYLLLKNLFIQYIWSISLTIFGLFSINYMINKDKK